MNDDWGRDPSVRFMRRVFKRMEETQTKLLADATISSFDGRLPRWRKVALDLFERAWPVAARHGLAGSEGEAGILYGHCLAQALVSDGIQISEEAMPHDERVTTLLREVKP
jgi:hypothetical protein